MAILNQVRPSQQQQQQQQQQTGSFGESRVLETLQNVLTFDSPHEVDFSLQTQTQQTMLHLATIMNWPTLCSFLLENGVNPDVTDRNEFTALHFAAWMDRPQILKMLFLARANLSLKNAFGQTARELTHPRVSFSSSFLVLFFF